MSSTTPVAGKSLTTEHREAAEKLLDQITTDAGSKHQEDPKDHVHAPANHARAHAWFRSVFPKGSLEHLENGWHMGNYVIDRQTGEKSFEEMSIYVRLGMHMLYYGSEQEKALHWKRTQELLREQSVKMGEQYDAPASKDHIKPFIESFHLENTLADLKKPDPTSYINFNEFFARELKESARPIAEPDNELTVSSPADCRLTVFPTVDLATRYWIKGFGFSLSRLLNSDDNAKIFDGGSINIARLAPQDYHRWHAPISGTVKSIYDIPGTYYTVNPQAITEPGTLDVFCENRRSVMMVERSPTKSPVAIIAVGAMLVGSMKYNPGIQVGSEIRRGQCLGAFYYGGSTVIVLYPKGEVQLDVDLVKNSMQEVCETVMTVGWRVGITPS